MKNKTEDLDLDLLDKEIPLLPGCNELTNIRIWCSSDYPDYRDAFQQGLVFDKQFMVGVDPVVKVVEKMCEQWGGISGKTYSWVRTVRPDYIEGEFRPREPRRVAVLLDKTIVYT